MFQGGDAGGQAAITELIKEATLLSSMRHPNVVWVYGIVLKPMTKDDESDDDELDDRDGGELPYMRTSTCSLMAFAIHVTPEAPNLRRFHGLTQMLALLNYGPDQRTCNSPLCSFFHLFVALCSSVSPLCSVAPPVLTLLASTQ